MADKKFPNHSLKRGGWAACSQVPFHALTLFLSLTLPIAAKALPTEVVVVETDNGAVTCGGINGVWQPGRVRANTFVSYTKQIKRLKKKLRNDRGRRSATYKRTVERIKRSRRKAVPFCREIGRPPHTPTPGNGNGTPTPQVTAQPTASRTPGANPTATPTPPSSTDRNAHFEAQLTNGNLHAFSSLRSQEAIDLITGDKLRNDRTNDSIRYDGGMDAAKVIIKPGDADIPGADQLFLRFPKVVRGDGNTELSFQWDARWSSSYLGSNEDGLVGQKFVRLMYYTSPRLSAGRRFEITNLYSGNTPQAGYVFKARIRTYGADVKDPDNGEELPGGSSDPFLIYPDVWVRFTLSVTYTDTDGDGRGEQRLRVWMADENRDPVLLMADPTNPERGFLTDISQTQVDSFGFELAGLEYWTLTLDSSQSRNGDLTTPPLESWVRNVLVFKNGTIPLGGRPKK